MAGFSTESIPYPHPVPADGGFFNEEQPVPVVGGFFNDEQSSVADEGGFFNEQQPVANGGGFFNEEPLPAKGGFFKDEPVPASGGFFNDKPVPTHNEEQASLSNHREDDSNHLSEKLPQPEEVPATKSSVKNMDIDLDLISAFFNGFRLPHEDVNVRMHRRASNN
ncbi:uncharacterized protein [Amphiura filiformis]|uniref:uncharacterized protein n=1 Tax=Amphiura filiformis TaxID=82378 RepID=UPI003B226A29